MGTGKAAKTSVIVLTYGDYRYLDMTLSSIATQICPIQKIIVSDDSSGKPFPAELMARYADVQFCQNKKNIGTVAHMNTAAGSCETKYLKFLAAGDAFSTPTALETLVNFAEKYQAPVVASQVMACDQMLRRRLYRFPGRRKSFFEEKSAEDQYHVLAVKNLISAVGTLFHQKFFTTGGFDETYYLLEDWPAWLRLTRQGISIPFLDQVTGFYGIGCGISSAAIDAYGSEKLKADMCLCYEKEIIPYLNLFSPIELRRISYGYDRVKGLLPEELLRKYGSLECKTRWKRWLKKQMLWWR